MFGLAALQIQRCAVIGPWNGRGQNGLIRILILARQLCWVWEVPAVHRYRVSCSSAI